MNRRLLFLITSLTYGGAESQVVELALGFARAGWSVRVVCMTPLGPKARDLQTAGVPVDSLGMRPGHPDLRGFWRLVWILRRFQPLVLHAHMVHANLLARLVRPWVRVPLLICTAHNIHEGGRWREVAYRLTDPLCDLTTQVSQAGLRRYLEVGAIAAGRGLFMPNGVDTRRFAPDDEARMALRREMGAEGFVWLAAGRFTEPRTTPTCCVLLPRWWRATPRPGCGWWARESCSCLCASWPARCGWRNVWSSWARGAICPAC